MRGRCVELYSDFACPFCYLAEVGAEGLERAGISVEYRAYELRPSPVPLASPASDLAKRRGWDEMIGPLSVELGLSIVMPAIGVRTRKAHEAAKYAKVEGVERAMRNALFAAYFAEGRDIGRIDVLVEIAESVGLDRTGMKVTLDIDQHTDAVIADEARALGLGLNGVPAYVVDEGMSPRVVVGLQDYERLLSWMETK